MRNQDINRICTLDSNQMYQTIYVLLFIIWFCGCTSGLDQGNKEHIHETQWAKRTVWDDQFELYLEHEPLVIDRISQLAIHLTRLEDHKPLATGQIKAKMVQGEHGISNTVEMTSPGIFRTRLKPNALGYHRLILTNESPAASFEIVLDSVYVHATEKLVNLPQLNNQGTTFTKEQSWEMNFLVEPAQLQSLNPIIRTSGVILPVVEDGIAIAANAAGFVHYRNLRLVQGESVGQGEWLATIKGDEILGGVDAERNLAARYASTKAKLSQAKASFNRHVELYEAKIIPLSDYEMSQTEYQIALSEYEAIASGYLDGGKKVLAPRSGYIKEILAEPGEYVRVGTSLLEISQNRKLRIQVDLPQKYYSQIDKIKSMSFRTSSNDQLYTLEELDGHMVSYGRNLEQTGPLILLYFEVANTGQLLSGSFIEAFLKIGANQEKLAIPNEAIMEDYGRLTVFVQTQGEEYEQREIQIGQSDGKTTEVTQGLENGERVVSKGAYQVKMASVSKTMGHSHTH